jgi:hypothetical protein
MGNEHPPRLEAFVELNKGNRMGTTTVIFLTG